MGRRCTTLLSQRDYISRFESWIQAIDLEVKPYSMLFTIVHHCIVDGSISRRCIKMSERQGRERISDISASEIFQN